MFAGVIPNEAFLVHHWQKDTISIGTVPKEVIEAVVAEHKEAPQKRVLQRRLADEVTLIVHGEERLKTVHGLLEVLFNGADLSNLLDGAIDELAKEIPVAEAGVSIVEAMVAAGVAAGNGAARRLIDGGGVKLNGEKVTDTELSLSARSIVKIGKNKFILVR